jgi:hypothetical protein
MTRVVQLRRGTERRVALVDEPRLRLLDGFDSGYALAQRALVTSTSLRSLIESHVGREELDYDAVYDGRSPWTLLVPIDHPRDSSSLLVSGTGLTHLGSAKDRQAMHQLTEAELTDSMRMFRSGVEGGRPPAGAVGAAPEWFYKGNGTTLRAHGEQLTVPPHGEDGGEEAEVAGVYLIAGDGQPWRIGMCAGNEFSDHKLEKRNYLHLAGSKLRDCSLGPELVVDPSFESVHGTVAIERSEEVIWSRDIHTGEEAMSHSLRNIEHHHFKFGAHRRPGDVHVHYFGACGLSFGDGLALTHGDVMCVQFETFGRPLRNPLNVERAGDTLMAVGSLA